MAEVTKESIESAIKGYVEPHLGRDLVTAGVVKGIAIEGDQVKVKVVLASPPRASSSPWPRPSRSASWPFPGWPWPRWT